jgi:hypothetical protein
MVRKLGFVLAALAIVLTGLGPAVAAAQQPQEQARTFVGAIAGLENIGAMFVVIVAPDRRAAAFIGSRDDTFNQSYAKWYIGAVNPPSLVATASDGTQLTGTLQGDTVTGTLGSGQWTGTVTQTGTAGIYRARVSDSEVDVAIAAPDGSWVGMAVNPTTGQLIRTWNSGTGVAERIANTTRIRIQPAPDAAPVELDLVTPDPGGAFYNSPWS